MKIAFIGLGQMGKGMALNMIKSGAELIVNDIDHRYYPEFEKHGAKVTANIADTAEADILFFCLPDSKTVKEVICSEPLFPLLRKGQILVDFSTINYKVALEIGKLLEEKGVHFIDAPISGSPLRANEGTMTIMCGGDEKVFESIKKYLDCAGKTIIHMGELGSGQLTKLINQLFLNINVAAATEILPMAAKLGLDCEKVIDVVNNGTGRSHVSEYFAPRILNRQFFEGGLSMKVAYKDMICAAEIGAEFCIPTPVLAAATTTYQMALLNGLGDCDKGGMIQVHEKLLNVTFKKSG
ncbi:MAG: NAD(P)-dependent oxidoreductase [Spirochaetes bacterium]|nr:NAD(P)-dependent oxidoreductase [Spirochaetota bacterium]